MVHKDWFNYGTIGNINLPDGISTIPSGIQVTPKKTLKGKVTIPKEYNGMPVVSISGFSGCTELTHVFVERNSTLRHIDSYSFTNLLNLKYFDFSTNTVQLIGEEAFFNCPLTNTNIGTAVQRVMRYAFNGAFCPEVTSLTLPASLIQIDDSAFSYLMTAYGASLQIGDENNYSALNLGMSYFGSSSDIPKLFWQNEGQMFSTIIFFSKFYDKESVVSIDGVQFKVEECFMGDNYNASFTINKEGA